MWNLLRTIATSLSVVGSVLLAASADAADQDGTIEWNGISHYSWQDCRPICPLDGETFEVRIQTWQNDLTAGRVRVDDGSTTWVDAEIVGTRGPYDIWAADVPATAASSLEYYFELTDGAATDYYGPGGMSADPPASGLLVDFTTLSHAPIGATLHPSGDGIFKVWAPTRTTVNVRGAFNGWDTSNPMSKLGEHFTARVTGVNHRHQYKYWFNSSVWNTDARARGVNPSDNLNSYVIDPLVHTWVNEDFWTPPFEELVIYQLHVGTFAGFNDPFGATPFPSRYIDVTARASQLAELGVNAVMLNPITEFPGDLSGGYNPQSQFAPEWKYGTPTELKAMIDELHTHGIAVLLDLVWNHFSASDNFMWNYDGTQIYFDDPAVETPWGSQADFDNGNVRAYFLDSMHQWFEEFRIDGFRMDGTDYMNLPEQESAGWSLMQALNDQVDNRWANKVAIAEQLPDDSFVTRPTSLDGAGFDMQYHDAFNDRLREVIFAAAAGDPEMWKIQNIVNGSGSFLNGRYVVNYLELHDEAWPTSGGQRLVKTIDTTVPHDDEFAQGRTKLGQGIVFTAPGTPAFLQGTEWLEDADFGTDPENRIDWSKKTTYAPIFEYYKDLIALRKQSGALHSDAPQEVFHLNESGNVIAWQRYDFDGNVLVIVANFANTDYAAYRIGLPQPNSWHEELNSQSLDYGGNGLTNPGNLTPEEIAYDGHPWSIELDLPRMGLIVLQPGDAPTDVPLAEGSYESVLQLRSVTPNPTLAGTTISFALSEQSRVAVTIHDTSGRRLVEIGGGVFQVGEHRVVWDGTDGRGNALPAGAYSVRLASGKTVETGRIIRLR